MDIPETTFKEEVEQETRIRHAAETSRDLAKQLDEVTIKHLIGVSPAFTNVVEEIKIIASSDATVLLTGETGTGKDICARAIHYSSVRRGAPFIPINCGAIPDELFENTLFGHERGSYTDAQLRSHGLIHEAERGTIFLDDIECLSARNQTKLLRFLETHRYLPIGAQKECASNIRVLSATNENLLARVHEKSFRDDLYFRLAVLTLSIPPLRTRTQDILPLAYAFLTRFASRYQKSVARFSSEVEAKLLAYNWPGNIRELENTIHRAVVHAPGEAIEEVDIATEVVAFPLHSEHGDSFATFKQKKHELVANFEREYLKQMLDECHGNISEAARRAGKDRRAFWELMHKYNITRTQ
jgi:DNA-binding NtrC family response regulator